MDKAGKLHKICMVTQSHYVSDPRVRREAELAAASGLEVIALSLGQDGEKRKTFYNGVEIYNFPLSKKRAGLLRYAFEYATFFTWATWMLTILQLRRGLRIIQVHTLPDFLIFSAIIPRLLGARLILDMHEIMPEFFASKFKIPQQHFFIKLLIFIERCSIRFADAIITVNDPIKELLIRRGVPPEKITVVMNSVDEAIFDRAEFQLNPSEEKEELSLMYHGTLTDIYGLDVAIRAIDLVRQRIPQARFHIFGDGPASDDLHRLVSHLKLGTHVIFHGRVPLDRIPKYLASCDAGILPTRQDEFLDLSFSNKLLEYVYMNKPVVCSRLRTTREYFRESSLAFFTPHDHAELADRILSLFQESTKRERQVASAQEDYQKIRWQIMKKRYLDVIQHSFWPQNRKTNPSTLSMKKEALTKTKRTGHRPLTLTKRR